MDQGRARSCVRLPFPMKHLRLLSAFSPLLPLLLLAAPAQAQGRTDLIGLYTEADGSGVSHLELAPGPANPATIYLCITGGSDPTGISAWELVIGGMDYADGVVVTDWDLTWGQGVGFPPLNFDSPPGFIVGVGGPIPWSDSICVMSIDFYVLDGAPKEFTIHESNIPSLPDHAVYVSWGNPGTLVPLDWDCGGESYPAFVVNGFTDPLELENHALSEAEGGDVHFVLDAGPAAAGREYLLLGSMSGTSGIGLPGGGSLPLTQDGLTRYIYLNANDVHLQDFRGSLDADGRARATLTHPGPFPVAAPTTLTFAWTTLHPDDFQSNFVAVQIVP